MVMTGDCGRDSRVLAAHRFGDILVRVVKDCALASESSERRVYDLVLRIGASGHAQQDVGIKVSGALIVTCSGYVPGQTKIVALMGTALTAP
jgi:hypothetical protein